MEHERVEELLAGYTLGALSGEDAQYAEQVLSEHVPTCLTCRRLLDGFRTVAGDLALAAAPAAAPDGVWTALRESMAEADGLAPPAPRRRFPTWAAAAAAVLVLGLGGWNIALNQRVTRAEDGLNIATQAMSVMSDPASQVVPLETRREPARMAAVYVPGDPRLYLMGEVPRPGRGRVYQVWFVDRDGQAWSPGTFVPRRRTIMLTVSLDVTRYDSILITEEPEGGSVRPSGDAVLAADV